MFREEKNLKDSSTSSLGIALKDSHLVVSYTKTNKLITALYMVTDIIDKDEPLRNKLRTLGTEIISDMNTAPAKARGKIGETMSFLDIASAVGLLTEMNCNILKKEFIELNDSINEALGGSKEISKHINLTDFFEATREEDVSNPERSSSLSFKQIYLDKGQKNFKGHGERAGTSIGVQKGSTLLKALSKVAAVPRPLGGAPARSVKSSADNFDVLKKQRRDEISGVIRKMGGGATITDIKNGAYGSLVSCGEKTLQRELVSMIKDNLLTKTGEKRWSRYFIK